MYWSGTGVIVCWSFTEIFPEKDHAKRQASDSHMINGVSLEWDVCGDDFICAEVRITSGYEDLKKASFQQTTRNLHFLLIVPPKRPSGTALLWEVNTFFSELCFLVTYSSLQPLIFRWHRPVDSDEGLQVAFCGILHISMYILTYLGWWERTNQNGLMTSPTVYLLQFTQGIWRILSWLGTFS